MVPHWSVKWTQLHSRPFAKHSCGFLATCLTCMVITPTINSPTVVNMVLQTTAYLFCYQNHKPSFYFFIMDHMSLTGIKGKQFLLELGWVIRKAIFTDVSECATSIVGVLILPLSFGDLDGVCFVSRSQLMIRHSRNWETLSRNKLSFCYFKSFVIGIYSHPLITLKYW